MSKSIIEKFHRTARSVPFCVTKPYKYKWREVYNMHVTIFYTWRLCFKIMLKWKRESFITFTEFVYILCDSRRSGWAIIEQISQRKAIQQVCKILLNKSNVWYLFRWIFDIFFSDDLCMYFVVSYRFISWWVVSCLMS